MSVKERILALWLIEKQKNAPDFFDEIKVEAQMRGNAKTDVNESEGTYETLCGS